MRFKAKDIFLHVISEKTAADMTAQPGNPWENVLEQEDHAMIESFQSCLQSVIDQTAEGQTSHLLIFASSFFSAFSLFSQASRKISRQ